MVTNELLLKKIKEQVNEAEQIIDDPILFKEALKRIEVLCELITEENIKSQSKTKITPEMISSTNSKLKKESLGKTNNQINTNLPSDSIFDF